MELLARPYNKCNKSVVHQTTGSVFAVLECTNEPEAIVNGMRSWSGSRALKTMVLYTCHTGYTLKNNGQSQANFTVTCQRSSDALLFGGVPDSVSCVADPTTTTTTTTTTTEATTAEPTTTELTRPTPHETPYVPSEHTTFTNSLFLSITIPAVAGERALQAERSV
ncbi:hypothetical protein FJT64_010805 [Amphibalanus amphitrite]|uniref:Sushi domain-containing protein n=1 Tax=Amphibalanus amphitrite TaxID=1232801 RepID=A0A6A4V8Y0_AMPAM|nr:hypothetical protein FJT64_010805 [Amphibalanus amphitrite]